MIKEHFDKLMYHTAIVTALCAIIVFGWQLRMIPLLNNPILELQRDSDFHYRICIELLTTGKIPSIDKLSIYPIGKKIFEECPPIFYYATVAFHHLAAFLLKIRDLKANIFSFNSLCGALMAVPVFLTTFSITRRNYLALIAAFASVTLPLGITRSYANFYRPEVLGSVLFLMSFSFLIRAINAGKPVRAAAEIILSSVFLVLAIGTWRMNILFFVILSFAMLLTVILLKERKNLCVFYLALSAGYLSSCSLFPYLQAHKYIFSVSSFFIISTALFMLLYLWFLKVRKISLPIFSKTIAAILCIVIGLSISFFLIKYDPFASLENTSFSVVKLVIAEWFNNPDILTAEDRIIKFAGETPPMQISDFVERWGYSWAIILLLLYFYANYLTKGRELLEESHLLVF
ncbi:MAG: hypothetical protein PHP46_03275, partial [Candidatus Omnitrophica bacterium]|nr:hypothetical protein [Candidatus Omnitrophota bacterium]